MRTRLLLLVAVFLPTAWAGTTVSLPPGESDVAWADALDAADLDVTPAASARVRVTADGARWRIEVRGDPPRRLEVAVPHSEADRSALAWLIASLAEDVWDGRAPRPARSMPATPPPPVASRTPAATPADLSQPTPKRQTSGAEKPPAVAGAPGPDADVATGGVAVPSDDAPAPKVGAPAQVPPPIATAATTTSPSPAVTNVAPAIDTARPTPERPLQTITAAPGPLAKAPTSTAAAPTGAAPTSDVGTSPGTLSSPMAATAAQISTTRPSTSAAPAGSAADASRPTPSGPIQTADAAQSRIAATREVGAPTERSAAAEVAPMTEILAHGAPPASRPPAENAATPTTSDSATSARSARTPPSSDRATPTAIDAGALASERTTPSAATAPPATPLPMDAGAPRSERPAPSTGPAVATNDREPRPGRPTAASAAAPASDDPATPRPHLGLEVAVQAGAGLRADQAPSAWGGVGVGLVVSEHALITLGGALVGPERPSGLPVADPTLGGELFARAGWAPSWTWAPRVEFEGVLARHAWRGDGATIATAWVPALGGRVGLTHALPRGTSLGIVAGVRGDLRRLQIVDDTGETRTLTPLSFEVGVVTTWRPRSRRP